jgi:hypothetical protein
MYKAEKVLRFIAESPTGRTASEIQQFICGLNGKNWDELEDRRYHSQYLRSATNPRPRRKHRGIWSVNLWCSYAGGLLYRFCVKKAGRWIVVRPIPSKGFYTAPRICRAAGPPHTWYRETHLPTASELGARLFPASPCVL